MDGKAFRDPGDLVISTEVAAAAHAYSLGVQLLITSAAGSGVLLRAAVAADPQFALARVALVLAVDAGAIGADGAACEDGLATRPEVMTRRERQHVEVIRLVLSGERERAAVLGREHLREFPGDVLVSHVLASRGLD